MYFCFQCQKPFSENDIVVINGSEEDIDLMKTKLEIRQAKIKSDKKGKNLKKEPKEQAPSTSTSSQSEVILNADLEPKTEQIPLELPKTRKDVGSNSIMKPHKRQAPETSMQDPVYKKTKDDYSVANDPKASNVFKSLFTSHQSEKDQKRAHWITYNPFYN